jgi:putative peptidoglycan lipid II flippase
MSKKFTSTVAGASILITVVGLLGKGLGLFREIIFANSFGISVNYNLYLVGAVLPLTINTIILYIGQNYFIPNYNRVKVESPEYSDKFISSTFWIFTIGGIVLSSLLLLFSKDFIALYLKDSSQAALVSTIKVFKIFLITIPINSASSILAAYLQSEFEFKYPAYSQLFLNISVIFLVMFFSGSIGVLTIPLGYVLGNFLRLGYLILKTYNKINLKITSLFKWEKFSGFAATTFLITILIESISQLFLLADRYFYHFVDKGGIASLNYAMNLFLLPVSIISVALSTAIFPALSQSFNEKNWDDLKNKLNNFYSINTFLFVPIGFILIVYGDVIIKLLFQRGQFGSNATLMTFDVLKFYVLSIIFYSSYAVINKLFYSANLIKWLLILTIAGCALKIYLNFSLVGYYKQVGLAISTSISYLFYFLCGAFLIYNKLKIGMQDFLKGLFFSLLNGFISFLIVTLLSSVLLGNNMMLNGLAKLTAFIFIYTVNSKVINQNAVKIFGSVYHGFRQSFS